MVVFRKYLKIVILIQDMFKQVLSCYEEFCWKAQDKYTDIGTDLFLVKQC